MLEVVNLALPFFGLIFLGFGCGKFKVIPDSGLAWMDFFILYVALPALFYRIVAQTPLEQLANPRFIVATMLATFCARQYDVWVEQASNAVLFGTLTSVATLTTVMWLVKTHQLPFWLFR